MFANEFKLHVTGNFIWVYLLQRKQPENIKLFQSITACERAYNESWMYNVCCRVILIPVTWMYIVCWRTFLIPVTWMYIVCCRVFLIPVTTTSSVVSWHDWKPTTSWESWLRSQTTQNWSSVLRSSPWPASVWVPVDFTSITTQHTCIHLQYQIESIFFKLTVICNCIISHLEYGWCLIDSWW